MSTCGVAACVTLCVRVLVCLCVSACVCVVCCVFVFVCVHVECVFEYVCILRICVFFAPRGTAFGGQAGARHTRLQSVAHRPNPDSHRRWCFKSSFIAQGKDYYRFPPLLEPSKIFFGFFFCLLK